MSSMRAVFSVLCLLLLAVVLIATLFWVVLRARWLGSVEGSGYWDTYPRPYGPDG
jgi:hypothetical protein